MVLSRDLTVVAVLTRVSIEIGGKKQRGEGKGKDLEVEKRVVTESSGDGADGKGGFISVVLPHVLEVVEVLTRLVIERAAAAEGKGKDFEEENGDGGGVLRVVLLPHELVSVEVLTRLPVKSLMRFKSVSKLWLSTICDPSFSKAHHHRADSRSGVTRLFITYQDAGADSSSSSSSSLRCFFSTLPRHGKSEFLHPFTLPDHSLPNCAKYNGATQVINGLVCFYAGNRVSICNISTREIMDLPSSDLHEDATNFTYYFAFAPISKEYKLVKLCCVPSFFNLSKRSDSCSRECEILALGSGVPSWRRLTRIQSSRIDFWDLSGVSVDGAICFWHGTQDGFLIFNCEDESFQEIACPPLPYSILSGISLLPFRGHFALVCRLVVDQKLQLWVLEMENQGQSLSYEWIHQVIDIPCDFPVRGFNYLGNLPTGEILFTGVQMNNSAMNIYSYDHTKGKFEKFEVGMFPSSKASIGKVRVNYCEEDITPLNCSFPFRTTLLSERPC